MSDKSAERQEKLHRVLNQLGFSGADSVAPAAVVTPIADVIPPKDARLIDVDQAAQAQAHIKLAHKATQSSLAGVARRAASWFIAALTPTDIVLESSEYSVGSGDASPLETPAASISARVIETATARNEPASASPFERFRHRQLPESEAAVLHPTVRSEREALLQQESRMHGLMEKMEAARFRYLIPHPEPGCQDELRRVARCFHFVAMMKQQRREELITVDEMRAVERAAHAQGAHGEVETVPHQNPLESSVLSCRHVVSQLTACARDLASTHALANSHL
jgi:hypothetical protein